MVDVPLVVHGVEENKMNLLNINSLALLAQSADSEGSSVAAAGFALLGVHLVAAIVFAVLGIVLLFLGLWLMEKLTPFSVMREIEEDQNQALAIIMGAIVIGISIIIAAAIVG